MRIDKVNVAEKLSQFSDYFNPRIAGELNGQIAGQPWLVKLVKFKGGFVWHHHENEDELFYVVKGSFDMHIRSEENSLEEKVVTVSAGEFIIMPKGVLHKPVANEEVEIMLFEPGSTLNTGNITDSDLTRDTLQKI
jgi:mannose-6-phosphate isomerase-like protein (cupin superfamily)